MSQRGDAARPTGHNQRSDNCDQRHVTWGGNEYNRWNNPNPNPGQSWGNQAPPWGAPGNAGQRRPPASNAERTDRRDARDARQDYREESRGNSQHSPSKGNYRRRDWPGNHILRQQGASGCDMKSYKTWEGTFVRILCPKSVATHSVYSERCCCHATYNRSLIK